ncbi:hypothetical protein NIES73_43700 [Sphaerospermopsis kisseleviana NIES-73]|jgi:hypothetical protein|nr:hypothetical protein NIES73_43700 [Sphaerospermopsis kisseleviana NIES-73]
MNKEAIKDHQDLGIYKIAFFLLLSENKNVCIPSLFLIPRN